MSDQLARERRIRELREALAASVKSKIRARGFDDTTETPIPSLGMLGARGNGVSIEGIKEDASKWLEYLNTLQPHPVAPWMLLTAKLAVSEVIHHVSRVQEIEPQPDAQKLLLMKECLLIGFRMSQSAWLVKRWFNFAILMQKDRNDKVRRAANLQKGVDKRQSKAEVNRDLCRQLARQHIGEKSIRQAAKCIDKKIRNDRLLVDWEPPSRDT